MHHIVKLIQRRFPGRSTKIIGALVILSVIHIAVGLVLLLR